MAADLSRLPKDRLAFFIDVDHQPVCNNSAGAGARINEATLVLAGQWLRVLAEESPISSMRTPCEILHRISRRSSRNHP